MSELHTILSEATPLLETALREVEAPQYDTDLQLRGSVCGLATAALQLYVRNNHNLTLDRRIASPSRAPRGLSSRRLEHVVLFDGSKMIDPSYGQFFAYVGLSREAVHDRPKLARLYPDDKVVVINRGSSHSFADAMATHMHTIEPEVAKQRNPHLRAYPPENSLVDTTLDEKRAVLRDIWDPTSYRPFPLEGQSDSFYRRALSLATKMYALENTRR